MGTIEIMPLLIVLFASIPEEFLITVLGLKLFGVKIRPLIGKIVVIAILQAAISFSVRLLPLPFGIHTILQIPLFALPLYLLLGLPYLYSLVVILISATLYTILDASIIPLLLYWTGIPLETVLTNTTLRLLFFIPQFTVMLLLVIIVSLKKIKIFDINNYKLVNKE
ncbi:hypothetical protein [Desulfitobacterium hafniense]|uniref:hypothetical protein n=1 Tax=Desulfitobacterium hafniense TaxID=49338 RepID=UPI001F6058CA|nr:hypothetical protein [Desulfitobacterium hafniense]